MKRKSILFIVSIVLVLTLVFSFVACNNDDGSDDNDLPKIRLKDDMTLAEVKEALKDVKNYKYEYVEDGKIVTSYYTENGYVSIVSKDEVDECFAWFIEGEKMYELSRDVENSVEVDHDYTWMNVTEYYANINFCTESLERDLAHIEEEVEEGYGTFSIKNNKIIYTSTKINYFITADLDGKMYEIILSDFNKTTLPIEKYFPNYKDLAVEYVEEDEI